MEVLWDIVVSVGHAIKSVLVYVETHHWIFGFLAGGYIFYLHDRIFTPGSTHSTGGSTKSGSAWRLNTDGTGCLRRARFPAAAAG